MNGDDVMVTTLQHLSREIEGMRVDLRKVIELDIDARRENRQALLIHRRVKC